MRLLWQLFWTFRKRLTTLAWLALKMQPSEGMVLMS